MRLQWNLLPDEYDTYSITSVDFDTDLVNLDLLDSDNNEGHAEDISIHIADSTNIVLSPLTDSFSSSSNLQLNVNTDHSSYTENIAASSGIVHSTMHNIAIASYYVCGSIVTLKTLNALI